MARRILRMLGGTALLACALACLAAAATQTLDQPSKPTPVSSYGGVSVWSRYDPAQRDYQLIVRSGGVVRPLSARGPAPFDVDVGPAAGGGVAAVRSRCADPASAPGRRRCDLYRVDLTSGQERRIGRASTAGADEVHPAVSGNRVAWVSLRPSTAPAVYSGPLSGSGPPKLLDAVPSRECRQGRCRRVTRQVVTALDMDRTRVAVGLLWRSPGDVTAVRVARLSGGSRTILRQTTGSLTGLDVTGVAFDGGAVYAGVRCIITLEGCPGRNGVFRYYERTGRFERANTPYDLEAFSFSGGRALYLVGYSSDGGCESEDAAQTHTSCTLFESDALAFQRARRSV
jgi:hypothetical protein